MAQVFAVAGVGPICGDCLTIVEVHVNTLREDRVSVTCHRCHWTGTVEKTFTKVLDVVTVPPTLAEQLGGK